MMGVMMSTSDKVVWFSQKEEIDLHVNLGSWFSQNEGGEDVEVVSLVARVFEAHETYSNVHTLIITLYGFFLLLWWS
jgi:hypothetical protein